jgi:hypothetical protein
LKSRFDTLQLNDEWTKEDAEAVAARISFLEATLRDTTDPPRGHAYGDDMAQTISITTPATPTDLDGLTADLADKGFEFIDTSTYEAHSPGRYVIIYSISFSAASGSQHIEFSVAKNDIWLDEATSHIYVPNPNIELCVGGNIILDLVRDDTVKLQVQNETSSADVVLEHVNFMIYRIAF